MSEQDKRDLETTDSWDLDNPESGGPVKNRRTVVSVSFPSDAFQLVATAAEKSGSKTSEFIREAAVAKASPTYTEIGVWWGGGTAVTVVQFALGATTAQTEPVPVPDVVYEPTKAFIFQPA